MLSCTHSQFLNFYASLQDSIGLTPLTITCINGHTGTAKVLIEHGAIVDFFDKVPGDLVSTACMF